MDNETLVFDTGGNIVGIYSINSRKYTPYRGEGIPKAVDRLIKAKVIITFNGHNRDMKDISEFAGLPQGELIEIEGEHIDMMSECWAVGGQLFGSGLIKIYKNVFGDNCTEAPFSESKRANYNKEELSDFVREHTEDNERDVYMTLKLWELWGKDELKAFA